MNDLLQLLKTNDPFMFDEIFTSNTYNLSPEELDGATVIDIGANIGYFTVFAASRTRHPAHIISVEANYNNFCILLNNIKILPVKITPLLAGVYHLDGKVLHFSNRFVVSQMTNENEGEVSAVSITIKSLVDQFYSDNMILKMDIEGGEYYSLLLTDHCTLRKFKIITMETHPQPSDTHNLHSINLMRHRLHHNGFVNQSIMPMLIFDNQDGHPVQREVGVYTEKWVRQ